MSSIDLAALGNHLWQSTLFAVVAGGLALYLHRNSARTRYLLWFAASVKFLVPFSLLAAVGAHIPWTPAPAHEAPPVLLETAVHLAAPVGPWISTPDSAVLMTDMTQVGETAGSGNMALTLTGILWALGTVAVTLRWLIRWGLVRRALRESIPVDVSFDVPVRSSACQFEPGVIGILRPVLLLPRGLEERLTSEQLRAVLAHERCHVQWRDNLSALLHMAVEALFWFHPLVWWIGTRLVEERERACDEQVMAEGHAPESYAEGVLKVCEHYLTSSLPCVSGVSGADLNKRMIDIMRTGLIRRLSGLQKAVLATAVLLAVLTPIAIGILNSPPARAQATAVLPTIPTATAQGSATVPAQAMDTSSKAPIRLAATSAAVPVQATQTGSSGQRPLVFWDSPPRTAHPQYGSISVQSDGIFINNIPLHYLIAEAYGVTLSQLEGIRWYEDDSVVRSDCTAVRGWCAESRRSFTEAGAPPCCIQPYSIKTEGATPAGKPQERISFEPTVPDQYRPALRAFLEKEFGLIVKRSKTQVDGHVITVGAGGARLKPAGSLPPEIIRFCPSGCVLPSGDAGFGVEVTGFSPKDFAAILSKAMNKQIVDETGLKGNYHFDTWLARDGSPPREVKPAELFAKMEEQLGLHVEARRVTVDVIQVVSMKEPRSQN